MKIKLIVSAVILALILAACGSDVQEADEPQIGTDNNIEEAAASDDILDMSGREHISDDLPDMDFGGEIFSILQRTEWSYEFDAEFETGEVVNDAVYQRNLAVEERFNVKLNLVDMMGGWDHQDLFVRTIQNSVSAGDDEYKLVSGYAAYMPRLQTGGYILNLHDLPYLDFDKPWWSSDLKENLTINVKMFFITGDLSLSLWESILAVYFNKQLIADNNIENPYELVNTGRWTLDKLNEISSQVYRDVDGDGEMSPASDIFGYATDTGNLVDNFFGAFDAPVILKDENGVPYHAQNTQKMADIVDKVYEFLWENPGTYTNIIADSGPNNLYRYIFEEDRSVFLPEHLGNAQLLRGMDTDFGIIPYPKWNEQQENYLTTSVAYFSLFCVPLSVRNLEMTGIITEALCAESYKKVIPAFYDVSLKTKLARDDESSEMIDIIRSGLTFDFGKIYVTELAYSMNMLRDLMGSRRRDFVSTFERNENRYNAALENLLATFE